MILCFLPPQLLWRPARPKLSLNWNGIAQATGEVSEEDLAGHVPGRHEAPHDKGDPVPASGLWLFFERVFELDVVLFENVVDGLTGFSCGGGSEGFLSLFFEAIGHVLKIGA